MKTSAKVLTIATVLATTAAVSYVAQPTLTTPNTTDVLGTDLDTPSTIVLSTGIDRVAEADTFGIRVVSPLNINRVSAGRPITFKVNDDVKRGTINVVQEDGDGTVRIGGEIENGTFCFAINNKVTTGVVMYLADGIYFEMAPTAPGETIKWTPHHMSKLACFNMPVVGEGAAVVASTVPTVTTREKVPLLDSKPDAPVVLFMDFVGGSIQDPLWNGGKVIDAKPANYTAEQIKTAFDICAERYSAFNVNVTTDATKYAKAAPKSRMRVVLTTTSNFMPNYGGYAFISSYKLSGISIYSSTIPCFAFVNNVGNERNAGEVAAHELGHTFGLSHDGTSKTAYYTGQDGWAPIMGTSYGKSITQWSKGEYADANNKQDDLSVIVANPNMGFTSTSNEKTPVILGGTINATDVVSNSFSARYFTVNVVSAGTLNINVNVPQFGALNTVVEIRNGGAILAKGNPLKNLNSSASAVVTPGTYTVKVYGEGEGNPATTGFSAYGSIGKFILTGTLR